MYLTLVWICICETHTASHEIFLSVKMASILILFCGQETTTTQLQSQFLFSWSRGYVLLNVKVEYSQMIRKRGFAEIPETFLTAGHLDLLRPFPAAGHIATVMFISSFN